MSISISIYCILCISDTDIHPHTYILYIHLFVNLSIIYYSIYLSVYIHTHICIYRHILYIYIYCVYARVNPNRVCCVRVRMWMCGSRRVVHAWSTSILMCNSYVYIKFIHIEVKSYYIVSDQYQLHAIFHIAIAILLYALCA